jgi:TonB-linked SusC/RagA family outer membrane protein
MKKISLFCLFSVFSISFLYAQLREIKGTVSDSGGHILVGASVTLKGSSAGTNTNAKGEFTLKVPTTKTRPVLIISYVGYETQTITVKGDDPLVVKLPLGTVTTGEEVVVIGYQSVKRKDIPGAVSSIGAKDLANVVVSSSEEAITGKLAGVQVTTSEGAPGAQVDIKVRGGGSVTQSNAPLYIIDGIESDEGLSLIAPQDIESIDVLKDAAATAIYGSRAANGVVVVTTKGGKNTQGRTTISYNGFVGLNKLNKELSVMDPYQYMLYQYERGVDNPSDTGGLSLYGPNTWATVQKYKDYPVQDWQKTMFGRNAIQQTHNVSVSGGNAQTQYYLSYTHNNQDGIFLNSEYARDLVNFRFDHKATDKLKLGFNVRYNHTVVDGAGTTDPSNDQSLSFLRQIIRYRPFLQPGESAGTYDPNLDALTNADGLILVNPVLLDNQTYRNNPTDNIVLSGYLNYQLTNHISFRTTLGYDIVDTVQNSFNDTITPWSQRYGARMPGASINQIKRVTINNSNVFTYTNADLNAGHVPKNLFTVILGEETYKAISNTNFEQVNYFPVGTTAQNAFGNLNLAGPGLDLEHLQPPILTPATVYDLGSLFTSARYNLHSKYMFTASIRADASSVFSASHKWGYFPSGSFSWLVSKERFMDKYNNYISDLKIRISTGLVGNARIPGFLDQQWFTSNNPLSQYGLIGLLQPGYNIPYLANPNLQWESTFSRNLGIDFGVFRNKIQVSADVYSNTTRNLLVNVPLPVTSGYTFQIQNAGSTNNLGVELQLNGTVMRTKNFTWNFSFNIASNRNVIKTLGPNQNSFLINSGWAGASNLPDYIVQVGQKVGSMYGFVNDGFYKTSDFNYTPPTTPGSLGTYQLKPGVANDSAITSVVAQPGGIKFKDLNKDGIVDANDRQILGSNQPKMFGGFTQQFKYKNWDASIFINYRFGSKIFNDNKLEFTSGYTQDANLLSIANNRWRVTDNNGNTLQQISGKTVYGVAPAILDSVNKNASFWIPQVGSASSSFSPQSFAIENGSFVRINNITVGYSFPLSARLMKQTTFNRLRFYFTVHNVAVLTGYSGYDPEVNTIHASPLTPGIDYSAYPRSRSYVCGINLSF